MSLKVFGALDLAMASPAKAGIPNSGTPRLDDPFRLRAEQELCVSKEKSVAAGQCDQRLLYWNRLRAPGWPYFLRSFSRESRVSKPSDLSVGRNAASTFNNARAMP